MNCCTGLIFPQFHFVVDNTFSTILSIRKGIDPPNWNLFFRASSELLPTSDFLVATDWKFSVPVDAPHCTDVLGFGVCDSVPSSYPTAILPAAHSPVTILDPQPLSVTFVILPSSGCVKPLTPAVCPTRILAPLPRQHPLSVHLFLCHLFQQTWSTLIIMYKSSTWFPSQVKSI